jgi:hypothetical protein
MGKAIIPELLQAYHRKAKTWRSGDRGGYHVQWDDMEAFASLDVCHLGATLHSMLRHLRLEISIECLDGAHQGSELRKLGIPGGANDRLARFVDALDLLCQAKPRPETFAISDKVH